MLDYHGVQNLINGLGNTGQWHVLTNLNVVVAIPLVTAVGKERVDGIVTGLGDHFSLVKDNIATIEYSINIFSYLS